MKEEKIVFSVPAAIPVLSPLHGDHVAEVALGWATTGPQIAHFVDIVPAAPGLDFSFGRFNCSGIDGSSEAPISGMVSENHDAYDVKNPTKDEPLVFNFCVSF